MLDEIIFAFENIMASNEPVRLTNTYRGMPVSYSGQVLKVINGKVTVSVPPAQIVAMRDSRQTFIKSNMMPGVFKAKVSGVNWKQSTVELSEFEMTFNSIGSRALVRVEPREPILIVIRSKDLPDFVVGEIIEVSLKGLAIQMKSELFQEVFFGVGKKISMSYQLPVQATSEAESKITSNGIIRNIIADRANNKFRIGVQVFLDGGFDHVITKYLAQRQADLLKEIRDRAQEDLWSR